MIITHVKGLLKSNTFIAQTGSAVFVIDSGAQINDVLKALGERKPDAILITHEHFDHMFHVAEYADTFNCDVYAHAAVIDELHSNNLGERIGWGKIERPKSFEKFHAIKKDCSFEVAGVGVEAITAPGHSIGSLLFKIEDCLFTGDVLFYGTIGRTDFLPDGHELMQKSLIKLQDITFATAYHGHGKNSTFEEQQENITNFIE